MANETARDMKLNLMVEPDFLVRRHSNLWLQLIALVMVAFAVLYFASEHLHGNYAFAYAGVLLLVLAALAAVGYLQVQRNRDLLLMTEFQNALFTSTARLNYRFCMIVKRDGGIAYYDPGFQMMFPHLANQANKVLDDLFARNQLPSHMGSEILTHLRNDSSGVMLVPYTAPDGTQTTLVLHLDPLPKPKGYVAIRGREYVARRNQRLNDGETPEEAPAASKPTTPALPSTALSAMLDEIGTAAYAATSDGTLIYANRPMEHLLGYDSGALLRNGTNITQLVFQANGSAGAGLGKDAFDGEAIFLHASGGMIKLIVRQDSWHHADGSYGGCFGYLKPLSTQHTAATTPAPVTESAPTESFTGLLDALPTAVAIMQHDGTLLDANQCFDDLTLGLSESRPGGRFVSLFGPDSQPVVENMIQQLAQQTTPAGPTDVTIATSTPRSASLTLAQLKSTAQGAPLWLAHVVDTTEQKNLEMRFSHSQKMQAVGQLAGGVAHDFNNLLTAMIGFCDLLLMRHPAGDQSFADIMQVKQNANRAANLVRQLLAFSRRQTLQPELLDLTDVLAELSHLLRRLLGENVELKVVHGRDIGMVKADQGQLEQVLINLAVNARDAMAGTGGALTVQTKITTISASQPLARDMIAPTDEDAIADGEYVQVDITDTGCGIPREMIQKIFEPFFSTKEIGSGTGLGLATVYGIVKQTGGYVYVRSTLGSGTTFTLFFPRQSEEVVAQHVASDAQEQSRSDDLTGVATILLVEDETPVRTFACRALRNKGYTVIEADCAEAALEIAATQGNQIQLILSDVIMPGMNGPEMVEDLLQRHPNVKVIFMSGYAEDVLNNYGTQRGNFHFLPKPFTLKQLASKVKEVIEG